MINETIYQVVFVQGGYTCVDYETNNYEQAVEVMTELRSQMYIAGERNFDYIIKQLKKGD